MKANRSFFQKKTQTSKILYVILGFTDSCSPSIDFVARPLLVDKFSVSLTSDPRIQLSVAIYPRADETQVIPVSG